MGLATLSLQGSNGLQIFNPKPNIGSQINVEKEEYHAHGNYKQQNQTRENNTHRFNESI